MSLKSTNGIPRTVAALKNYIGPEKYPKIDKYSIKVLLYPIKEGGKTKTLTGKSEIEKNYDYEVTNASRIDIHLSGWIKFHKKIRIQNACAR